MKLSVLSQEEFILRNLGKWIEALVHSRSDCYSHGIEFGITELVRQLMRGIAQENPGQGNLLEQALELAEAKLRRHLQASQIEFEVSAYLINAQKTLRFSAREMSELGKQLRQVRQREQASNVRERHDAVPVEVIEVGTRDRIEGLLACPIPEVHELDLEGLQQSHAVEGEWFPFEVCLSELQFVLDDDGTIFVAVDNFPGRLLQEAKAGLIELAGQLYQRE